MKNLITREKLKKYHSLTFKALNIAKKSAARGKKKEAGEIILMVKCYLQDSVFFAEKGDFVNAFGCLNYAHGWLDCGARLNIFLVKDTNLFTV